MRKFAFAIALLAITACGEDKESGPGQAVKGKDEPAKTSDKEPGAKTFDRAAFCAQVFDKKSVEAIVGVTFSALMEYDSTERIAAARGAYALCKYREQVDKSIPKHRRKSKWVSAEVDCRERRLDLKEWERQARLYDPKGEYRLVDVGKRGGYSGGPGDVHQLLFLHSTVPCTIHVTVMYIDNKTEALARHVDGKLTAVIPTWKRRPRQKR